MKLIHYIVNYTEKEKGVVSLYKCKLTGVVFSWEDTSLHMNYLKRKKLI